MMVPLGGPQALLVLVAVACKLFPRIVVTVSILTSCVAGLLQEENVVRTSYRVVSGGGQKFKKRISSRPGVVVRVSAVATKEPPRVNICDRTKRDPGPDGVNR